MTKEYDRTNKGTLGKNKRREKDTHPEYTGNINIEGREFWISGWVKTQQSTGEKFFSLSVKPKDGAQEAPRGGGVQRTSAPADLDDDIPF